MEASKYSVINRASRLKWCKYKMICNVLSVTAQSELVVYLDTVLSSSTHSVRI